MRWNFENFTTMLLGLSIGLWFGSWLAYFSPFVPFLLGYPIGLWVVARLASLPRTRK